VTKHRLAHLHGVSSALILGLWCGYFGDHFGGIRESTLVGDGCIINEALTIIEYPLLLWGYPHKKTGW
jgi:hypothetical protein